VFFGLSESLFSKHLTGDKSYYEYLALRVTAFVFARFCFASFFIRALVLFLTTERYCEGIANCFLGKGLGFGLAFFRVPSSISEGSIDQKVAID
jgi:hypothetical protein